MLPDRNSPEFPAALKAAREAKGWTRAKLAQEAKIHAVMPRRYEEPDCSEFARPTQDSYVKLSKALGFTIVGDDDIVLNKASLEEIVAELASRGIGVTLAFAPPSSNGTEFPSASQQ